MPRFQKHCYLKNISVMFCFKMFFKILCLIYLYALLENWSLFHPYVNSLYCLTIAFSFHLLRNNFLAVIIGRTILVSWLVTRLYFHSQIRHGILKHKWGSYNQWQWISKIQLQCFTIWLDMTDCNLDYRVLQLILNCQ